MDYSQAFEKIRDIPYHLPCESDATDASCIGKHHKLKELLEEQGARVRYRAGLYSWDDVPLPHDILALPHAPKTLHVFLEILRDDRWEVLDATWDAGLRYLYTLNKWSDLGAMTHAVPIHKMFSVEESHSLVKNLFDERTEYHFTYNEFLEALNDWHARQRKT